MSVKESTFRIDNNDTGTEVSTLQAKNKYNR